MSEPMSGTTEATGTPYAAQVALRWSDMDAYAHINNVQFLRLLEDARVIAIGSRGHSGLKSALLGSVSHGVANHSTRPVLLVRGGH